MKKLQDYYVAATFGVLCGLSINGPMGVVAAVSLILIYLFIGALSER